MCWLLLLLGSLMAGIVWADRGGAWPTPIGVVSSAGAAGLGLGLALLLVLEADESSGRAARFARRLRFLRSIAGIAAIPLLVLTAASFGHAGLARELERARIGAARAEAADPIAIVAVDARVVARRPTRGGEEVELGRVRALRGGRAVPERLLLTISTPRPERVGERRDPRDVLSVAGASSPRPSRADRLLVPGAEVRLAVRIRPLHPSRNPGSPDRAHAWARRGLAARASLAKGDWVVERLAGTGLVPRFSAAASALRRAATERLRRRLEPLGDGQGLVRALALGDRRGLDGATQDGFRTLGLTHLLSVSGLHIGFVAWPVAWIVRRLRNGLRIGLRLRVRPRRSPSPTMRGFLLPVFAASGAAGCYAWVAGAELPAVRASLLFALFAASWSLGWRVAPGAALAAIALGLLASDPAALFDLGAQLSFGACTALVVGGSGRSRDEPDRHCAAQGGSSPDATASSAVASAPGREGRPSFAVGRRVARSLGGLVVDAVRTSLVVSLGMLPLIELHALPRALPSPLINALAIPWTGFVVMPCAFVAGLVAVSLPDRLDGADPMDPSATFLEPAAAVVGSIGTLALEGLVAPAAGLEQAVATVVATLPEAVIDDDRPGRIPWSVGIGAIALALLRLRSGRLKSAAAIWLVLAGFGLEPWPVAGFGGAVPRLLFFDVGQADAALLQSRRSTWLVDTGSGAEDGSGGTALVRALRSEGVGRLDVLVLTHGDLDHRGGALRLLSAVDVGELWLPRLERPDPALERIAERAEARGTRVRRVASGDRSARDPDLDVEVLWPPRPSAGAPMKGLSSRARDRGTTRNERSLVLSVELAGRRALFMADVGGAVEAALVRAGAEGLRSDVLKAGHHGSRQSSTEAFLGAVAPRVVIVSAPCLGVRGLPSEEALRRLRATGARLGWTGRDGALLVRPEGAGSPAMRYWGAPRTCLTGFARDPKPEAAASTCGEEGHGVRCDGEP